MNKNKFNFILIVILLFPAVHLYAQGNVEYYGTVKDSNTNKTISNVNVFIKDSNIGTTTGPSGSFVLQVENPDARMVIVFRHVGYDLLEISIDDVKIPLDIYLTPRIIPLSEFKVKGKRITSEYQKDLPLSISVIESQAFELRGFDDVGDLLRNEQSVQVEDDLSGRKTISLRGGNADETIVLYNGIKLNSLYNNIADISLIDLQDISRIEVIRGSNTVIYGSDAIAGVVNLVPRLGEGNHIRFKQKIGSYDTGQWTLNLNGNAGNFSGFLSARQSSSRRLFSGEAALNPELKNQSSHYTTNVKYSLGSNDDGEDAIFATAMITARDYENDRDEELLSNEEQLYSTRFIGDIPGLSDIELKTYIKYFEQIHEVKSSIGTLRRELKEDSFNLGIEKLLNFGNIEERIVYQFERANLDFSDIRDNIRLGGTNNPGIGLNRSRHGFVSITKFHQRSSSERINVTDFDISFRREYVRDEEDIALSQKDISDGSDTYNDSADETSYKFSYIIAGKFENASYNAYMTYGTNFKFPTLHQRISSIYAKSADETSITFEPEKVYSKEIGLELSGVMKGDTPLDGWNLTTNFFQNVYYNKIRATYILGSPIPLFDNVSRAKISGLEINSDNFFFEEKFNFGLGVSKYFISDKSVFPFKYDFKVTSDLVLNFSGVSIHVILFNEGDQVGWIRDESDLLTEITLPSYSNLDFHLSKRFGWKNFNLVSNISILNLIENDLNIDGLALRDRRFYLSIGLEY